MKIKPLFLVLVSFSLCACLPESEEDYTKIRDYKEFRCPSPGLEEFVAWGKTGRARRCVINNGSFVAAEGEIFLSGQYENGVEVGIWRWYGKDGEVMKEIDYSEERSDR